MHKSRILAFILLTAFALQAFSRLAIVTNYHVNTLAYAKHCENKARPALKCKGQCQMMKQLAAAEKHEQAPSENKSVEINPILFAENTSCLLALLNLETPGRSYASVQQTALLDRSSDIFRPPA